MDLNTYLIVGFLLFIIGSAGVLIRRNIIVILMSLELMLNGINLSFAAFSTYLNSIDGQVFIFFIMAVTAAEVAVGLALVISVFRYRTSANLDDFNLLKW